MKEIIWLFFESVVGYYLAKRITSMHFVVC